MSGSEIAQRNETATWRLNSRWKGLLEVFEIPGESGKDPLLNRQVEFLHRTVRDSMRTNFMQTMLARDRHTVLNIRLALISSYLAQIKRLDATGIEFKRDGSPDHVFTVFLRKIIVEARQHELEKGVPLTRMLDELDETGRVLMQRYYSLQALWRNNSIQWSSLTFDVGEQYYESDDTFLTLVMSAGLHSYVREKLRQTTSMVKKHQGRSLLDWALRPRWRPSNNLAIEESSPDYETHSPHTFPRGRSK